MARRKGATSRWALCGRLGHLVLAVGLLGLVPARSGSEVGGAEYTVKAAFLYNFTKFVDWPPQKEPDRGNAFVIGVVGSDPFGPALDALDGKAARGKRVSVRRISDAGNLEGCDILFVPTSESERVTRILNAVHKRSILTVSDVPEFAKRGGMIELLKAGERIRFRINAAAAEQVGLRISSHLLKLAVRDGENP